MALTQQQVDQYDVSTGFGMRKVEELQGLGATREQIIDIASRAPIIGDRAAALFPELSSWGSKEKADIGRVPPNFNWVEYLNANPDLDAAGIDTADEAKRHYALFGYQENRPNAPPPLPSRDERYQTIRTELENQYKALVKLAPAGAYQGRSSDLNAIFHQQASQLADAGVSHVGDLQIKDGRLINAKTGMLVTTSNLGGQVAVDRDTGVQKWGDIFSGVKGGANYGIQELPDGSVLLFPAWEKTKSPISQIGLSFLEPIIEPIATIAGTIIGGSIGAGVGNTIGQFLASGEVELERALVAAGTAYVASEIAAGTGDTVKNIGASVAPEASAATQTAIGEAAINAGVGAGIYAASGADPLTGALLGAAGSITSTTYAQAVGKSIAPSVSATAQITIGNAVLNSALSGVMAAVAGADVTKSMLAGAAKGAAIANTTAIAEALVGKENIAAIVKATNLSKSQVENIIATSVANGITAEITNTGKFLDVTLTSLTSNGIGTSLAQGVVDNINLSKAEEQGIFAATRNIASVATNAAIQGQDVGLALEMAAPGAILSGYQAYDRQLDIDEATAQREKELAALQQQTQLAQSGGMTIDIAGTATVLFTTPDRRFIIYENLDLIDTSKEPDQEGYEIRLTPDEFFDITGTSYEDALAQQSILIGEMDRAGGVLQPGQDTQSLSPIVVGIDLRTEASPSGGGTAIYKTATGATGTGGGTATWQIIGRDSATGQEIVDVNGESFTLIALPDDKQALVNPVTEVILYPEKDPVTNDTVLREEPDPVIAKQIAGGGGGAKGDGTLQAAIKMPASPAPPMPEVPKAVGGLTPAEAEAQLRAAIADELERLEDELQTFELARQETQRALQRAQEQSKRLAETRDVGRVSPETETALNAEIRALENQLAQSVREAETAAADRDRFGALQEEAGDLSDDDILSFLETGQLPGGAGQPGVETGTRGEGGTGGFGGDEGADGGTGGGAGGGEGGGRGPGTGKGDGGDALDLEPSPITTPLSPSLIFSRELPARPETTPFSSRVTGEALAGILGEKEPLFGGDEDEQRAVWNRRSLRLLSRALGL